jgi:hypothetical protein
MLRRPIKTLVKYLKENIDWVCARSEATGFLNVAPFSLEDPYRGFRGIYCLHFQGPAVITSHA